MVSDLATERIPIWVLTGALTQSFTSKLCVTEEVLDTVVFEQMKDNQLKVIQS